MDANSSGFMLQTMLYLVNHNSSVMNTIYNEKVEPLKDPHITRCYGSYGCFPVTGVWMIDGARPQAQ